jgi:hypothetical protein
MVDSDTVDFIQMHLDAGASNQEIVELLRDERQIVIVSRTLIRSIKI